MRKYTMVFSSVVSLGLVLGGVLGAAPAAAIPASGEKKGCVNSEGPLITNTCPEARDVYVDASYGGVVPLFSNTPCIPGNGGTYKVAPPFHLAKIEKLEVKSIRTKPTC